jgi:hypothetical protein
LTPWKPGQSGNPGGRPRRRPIAELLVAELEQAALLLEQLRPFGWLGYVAATVRRSLARIVPDTRTSTWRNVGTVNAPANGANSDSGGTLAHGEGDMGAPALS